MTRWLALLVVPAAAIVLVVLLPQSEDDDSSTAGEVSARDAARPRPAQSAGGSVVPLSFSPPSEYFSFASVFDSI